MSLPIHFKSLVCDIVQAAAYNKLKQASDYSDLSTTFDILVHPSPDAGFSYGWVNFSALSNSTAYQPFSMDSTAPCCIPVAPVADLISANNTPPFDEFEPTRPTTWRPAGAAPRGNMMGSCNLASGMASFTWYGNIYNISMAQGSRDAQVLVVSQTANVSAPQSTSGERYNPKSWLGALFLIFVHK